MIVNQAQRTVQPQWGLGLITPEITRLDLNGVGCGSCVRGLGADAATTVLLAIRSKLSGAGYLVVGPGGISNEERLAVNDALFQLNSPSSFATTSSYGGKTVVGNPTAIAALRAEIDAALRRAGVTPTTRPKWLFPVAIGAGALVLGGIVLAIIRR